MDTQNNLTDFQLQQTYWSRLQQFKFDLIFFSLHFSNCTFYLRLLKYISVGGTTLATGIWLNWRANSSVNIVCAIVIIALQTLSTISDMLPFERRKQELREMTVELDQLYIDMEDDWRKTAEGELKKEEIRARIKQYEEKQSQIKQHYFKDDSLPERAKIVKKATSKTEEYFKKMM